METTQVDTGITGAKRQSWRRANPRETLQRVITENPQSTEAEIREICWDEFTQGVTFSARRGTQSREYLETIFEYWFANNYRSLCTAPDHRGAAASQRNTEPRRQARQAAVAEVRARLEQHIEIVAAKKVNIILLEMTMPSGKQLRHSTREELTDLGGWAVSVAERLGPNQTVEAAGLTEAELQKMYEAGGA